MPLRYDAFSAAPVATDPYPHLVVPGFVPPADQTAIDRDFPRLDMAGLFPADVLRSGPAFERLLADLQGPELRRLAEEKFDIDLQGRPTMVTVRGCARARDGRIHRDATFKLVTFLLYLNAPWQGDGGRLRVLRSPDNIEDYAAEIPPDGGLLVAFKCTDNAWHGHKPYVGPRRYVMVNFVADEVAAARELARHRLSARVKQVKRLFGFGRIKAA